MSNLEFKHVSFAYDGQIKPLFTDLNLSIDSSWKLGLVGRNGRGKTTLLKMMQNLVDYQGKIIHQQHFVYFPQKINDPNELTYYLLQDLASFEEWELERELNLLNVDLATLWRPFVTLSGGEQTKVLLAVLFLDQNNFPLIDEPTNHLDLTARKKVAEYLQKKQQGFIVISHDRNFVDQTVNHIISIERNQLVLYQGNFSTYEQEKNLRDNFERHQQEKLQSSITRLKKTAHQKEQWSKSREADKYGNPHQKGSGSVPDTGFIGARAARMMSKRKNLEQRMNHEIEAQEKLLQNLEKVDHLELRYLPDHHDLILKLEHFSLKFGADQPLFEPISMELHTGQQIALVGENGVGKSTLINFIKNNENNYNKNEKILAEASGEIQQVQNLKISNVRQIYDDNVGTLADFAKQNNLDYPLFLNNLRKLGMEREVFQNKIENMSMGQQKKVELAKSLSEEANLFIWDEPLNYLDVFNQEQLTTLIKEYQPTMILIEHDQRFLATINAEPIELKRI